MGYHLPSFDQESLPNPNEVVVFYDHFIAGFSIPCHDFVLVVLDKYQVQLHEITPTAIAHLSKFVRAMVSYAGCSRYRGFCEVLHVA